MESSAFHEELQRVCSAYKALSDAKLRGWNSKTYVRPHVSLASCKEYAENYTKHLIPKLKVADSGSLRSKFYDIGSAPGGLCQAFLEAEAAGDVRNKWFGVALTLDPENGGIEMKYKNDSLEVRYADVHEGEKFLEIAVKQADENSYDFVNMGIVVDSNVKKYLNKSVQYHEQLITQLRAAQLLLKPGGSFMMVLNLDYPSLPEVLCAMHTLLKHAKSLHMIPTVYSKSAGRKQFYLLVSEITLTHEMVDELSAIWKKGHTRHVASRKRKLQERKDEDVELTGDESASMRFSSDFVKEVIQAIASSPLINEFAAFCDILTEAILEGHFI